jgi:sugar phosphate isomerase/epimerase
MRLPLLLIPLARAAAASGQDAKLRGGNILAAETYSFRSLIRSGELDMLSVPEFYRKLGIKGISYNDMYFKTLDDEHLDQVKAAVKKAGRVVVCYVIEGNLATADEAKRRAQIEANKQKMRAAHRLGAPLVRINIGGTGAENADDTLGVERVLAAFNELLPLARQLKLRMSIENHGGVSRSAANIVRIIRETDPKWVGAMVDFGNWPRDVRYQEVEALAPYAFGTHVKVNVFDENGEAAEYDFPRVLGMFKKLRYRGSISIEFEGKGDQVEGVRKSKALILKYW